MKLNRILLHFGLIATAVFIMTTIGLAWILPGYDPVSQTISEIGEQGSPLAVHFAVGLIGVGASFLLFAWGVYRFAVQRGLSSVPAYMLGFLGLLEIAIALFPAPHRLHNVFGIASTVGLLTPLVVPIVWRNAADLGRVNAASAVLGLCALVAIMFNISPLFVDYAEGDFVRANYGLVQRSLYLSFYLWCVYFSLMLAAEDHGGRMSRALAAR